MTGKGYVFEGTTHQSYLVDYTQRPECPSHDPCEPVEVLGERSDDVTVGTILERARKDLGAAAVLEFNLDLLAGLDCHKCGTHEPLLMSLSKVTEMQARCPRCGEDRIPRTFHTVDGTENFLGQTLCGIGLPAWDVIGARAGLDQRFYELAGDRTDVLGPLAV
jgi:hypothetical protein